MPFALNERKQKILAGVVIACFAIGFLTAIFYGSYLVDISKTYDIDFSFPIATNIVDVPEDWTTMPLVDIRVGVGSKCPMGSEPLFERNWFGLHLACDCRKSASISTRFLIGKGCVIPSCDTVLAQPFVRQEIQYEEK